MTGKVPQVMTMLATALALAGTAAPAMEAPALDGVWRNMRDTVRLHITGCGPALCGTVVQAAAQAQADARRGSGKTLIGQQLFRDFQPADGSTWKGKIYIPDLDRTASGRIIMTDHDSLTVSGCVFAGLFCKTQHWKRVSA